MLGACLAATPAAAGWFTSHASDALAHVNGQYVLNRPLADFDDSVFVWTDGGRARPRVVDLGQLARTLTPYDVVFYGEIHDHAGMHLEELRLLRALYEHDPRLVLSLEQFERDVQGVLDDYLADRIGETTLTAKARAWNNYAAAYRPLLVFAKAHHLPVIAAEAPDWTIACIGRRGAQILGEFTPQERSWIAAELHAGPGPYRDRYMEFFKGSASHGGGTAATPEAAQTAQHSFEAQAARDDTMAESIERAVRDYPGRKILHITGSFHAAGFLGTVERLRLRAPALELAVIEPVEVENPNAPAFAADRLGEASALQLVYPTPENFVDGEDMSAWLAKMAQKHAADACKYVPAAPVKPPG